MKFSICCIEPDDYRYSHFLYDTCKYLCFGIESTGHECCIVRNQLYPDRINVIVGAHNLNDSSKVRQIINTGRYVLLQSEIITGDSINNWLVSKSFTDIYLPLMQNALAVWEGVESNVTKLNNLGIRAELLKFGYHPSMEEIFHKQRKDIDFLFCGSITDHRKNMLEELITRGARVVTAFDEPAMYRNDLISRTRVNLAPHQGPEMNHLGAGRVLYLLNNRSILVVERCFDQETLEDCFFFADSEGWVDLCMETLGLPNLNEIAEEFFQRFKKIRMVDSIQPLVDKLCATPDRSSGIYTSLTGVSHEVAEDRFPNDSTYSDVHRENTAIPGLVSIIMLTDNQLQYTKECLESIRQYTQDAYEIIFVDNIMTDGTGEWQKNICNDYNIYKVIEQKSFSDLPESVNKAINASRGEYILLLNSNVLVTEDWLSGMLECLNSVAKAGIIGAMTNNVDGIQKMDPLGYESTKDLIAYARDFRGKHRYRRVPCRKIDAFCMLFRYSLVEQIGFLDGSLGAGGFEYDDYCLRAALEGYQNLIAGDVFLHCNKDRIYHGRNKRTFDAKWQRIAAYSPLGKKIAVLNSLEKADELCQKQEVDQAVLHLIEGIKYSPESKAIYYSLAETLIEVNRFTQAMEALDSMPEEGKHEAQWNTLIGYCKFGTEVFDEADTCADHALSIDTCCTAAFNLKGLIAFKNNKTELARTYFEKAIILDPGYGEPYSYLGLLQWSTDHREEALNLLEKGFMLSPKCYNPISLYHSAVTELLAFDRGERVFLEAKSHNPTNKRIDFLMIDMVIQQSNYTAAMEYIENVILCYGLDDGILATAIEIRNRIGTPTIDPLKKFHTLSVCMIAKNEEQHLAKCLMSIQHIADEIIVVDTGSIDRTKKIATAFGAQVYDFEWMDDFAAARNHSLLKAAGDWILVLDADEVISSQDHGLLRKLITQKNNRTAAYEITTRNYVADIAVTGWVENAGKYKEEAGTGWFPSTKVRLFKNSKKIRFQNPIHETIEGSIISVNITIKPCDIIVHHYGKLDQKQTRIKGNFYYELGKRKLAERPDNDKALYELAVQATELGRYDEAITLWNRLIGRNSHRPNAIYMLNLGSAHLFLGHYVEAIAHFKKTIQLDPGLKEAVLNYTTSEFYGGDPANALPFLENILTNNPLYPPASSLLAAVYCVVGREREGREIFESLKKQNYIVYLSMNDLCECLMKRGKYPDAARILQVLTNLQCMDKVGSQLLEQCQANIQCS